MLVEMFKTVKTSIADIDYTTQDDCKESKIFLLSSGWVVGFFSILEKNALKFILKTSIKMQIHISAAIRNAVKQ